MALLGARLERCQPAGREEISQWQSMPMPIDSHGITKEESTGMTNNGASPDVLEPAGELLWSIKTVILKTGLSRATIYRYTRRNMFPQKRRIGPNRVGWLAAEVIAWVATLPRPGE
jgi:prophage regulatory protein